MLMMTPLTIPLWLLISSLLLAGLIGAGCLWHGHVARFTQTLTRLGKEHHQLHGTLLVLRAEAGHAVRAHYDEGLNNAIRQADRIVMTLPLFKDRPNGNDSPMNTHTGSSLKTVHTASDHRSYSRLTVPF